MGRRTTERPPVKYFILFCLVDICTTIIGEINMINNVDEHPIPPI